MNQAQEEVTVSQSSWFWGESLQELSPNTWLQETTQQIKLFEWSVIVTSLYFNTRLIGINDFLVILFDTFKILALMFPVHKTLKTIHSLFIEDY